MNARAVVMTEFHLAVIQGGARSEEHTSELQSQSNLVCRLLLEKKKADDSHDIATAVQPAADLSGRASDLPPALAPETVHGPLVDLRVIAGSRPPRQWAAARQTY